MKRNKLIATIGLAAVLFLNSAIPVLADQFNVVTIGADLSAEQKETMLEYFNVKPNEYQLITINNQEEREALKNIASLSEIGTKTISCAYVQPTSSGGLNVKTTNLTWVTASMIQNALVTAGITNANVVAAAPFAVSGTGALTGILKAFEDASDEKLSSEKKELANTELKVTGDIAKDENIGQEKAAAIVNDIKTEIIKDNTKDGVQVGQTINNVVNNYGVTLSQEQKDQLTAFMEKIAKQDYDYSQLKETLNQVSQNITETLKQAGQDLKESGFFEKLWNKIKDFFKGAEDEVKKEDLGIINNTNNSVLGGNAVTTGSNSTIVTEDNKNNSKLENTDGNKTENTNLENSENSNTNESNNSGTSWWDSFCNWIKDILNLNQ